MAVRRLSLGQPPAPEARRRWHEERSLHRAMRMARVWYWGRTAPLRPISGNQQNSLPSTTSKLPDGSAPIAAMRERYLPESRDVLAAHYSACWAEGQPFAIQTKLLRSDGTQLDCVVHGEPEFAPNGQVQRVFGVVRDVTPETSAATTFGRERTAARGFRQYRFGLVLGDRPRPSAASLS